MKKYFITIILIICLAIGIPAIVKSASDITGAQYAGTILITNNGTAATYVSVNFSLDTQNSIDAGYISENCCNIAVRTNTGADTNFMPAVNSSYPWCVYVPAINQYQNLSYLLYTGGPDMSGDVSYFPGSGGMTTPDDTSMELGANWTYEVTGLIDTSGSSANIVGRNLRIYSPSAGNLTSVATIYMNGWNDPGSDWLYPQKTSDNDTASYAVESNVLAGTWSANLTMYMPETGCNNIWTWHHFGYFSLIDVDVYSGGAWHDVYQGASSNGVWENHWLSTPLKITAVSIRAYNGTGSNYDFFLNEVYIQNEISTTLLTSEYELSVTSNSTHYNLYVDNILQDTSAGPAYIQDSSTNWVFCQSGATPFIEYQEITINGTIVQYIEWIYGTTLTDASIYGNDATPTFRTGTSDPDVSATLITFEPITEAVSTNWTLVPQVTMIPAADIPSAPSRAYGTTSTTNLFMGSFFDVIVGGAGYLTATFWYPVAMLLICGLGLLIAKASTSVGTQLLVQTIAMFALSFTIIPWWCGLIFIFYGLGILLMSKQFGGV